MPRKKLKFEVGALRNEILKKREIKYETVFRYEGGSGILFLTNKALEFYYYKKCKKCNNFYIMLKDIENVSVSENCFIEKNIKIKTIDKEEMLVAIDRAKELVELMN